MWQCQALSPKLNRINRTNPDLAKRIDGQMGYLVKDDLVELTKVDRFTQVLLRCGRGRYTCPVQDAQNLIDCLEFGMKMAKEATGQELSPVTDYVRDISLPEN